MIFSNSEDNYLNNMRRNADDTLIKQPINRQMQYLRSPDYQVNTPRGAKKVYKETFDDLYEAGQLSDYETQYDDTVVDFRIPMNTPVKNLAPQSAQLLQINCQKDNTKPMSHFVTSDSRPTAGEHLQNKTVYVDRTIMEEERSNDSNKNYFPLQTTKSVDFDETYFSQSYYEEINPAPSKISQVIITNTTYFWVY